ncbi:14133_t:CDS:2 [Dentiscutata erythropus]|uniref:14133_t:CDS:1 n=1 Tax=Dentiscutata erythropus TaxID=1348616 RepID=A0A9N9AIR2_9GLOM|nr:14133_t:CDS:2 [Dentiscutata erythropus]
MCLQDDGLDPSHYVSAPGMFNDLLYKSSEVEIKLMTDMDEYLMVENGIRGGMTMVSQRYAKANNEKCPDYDPNKLKFWIMYEDMNALYSGAMTQYMPTEILGKVGPEEISDIQSIEPDAEIGYMLEVDLEAPINMQDFFADYPLAPEKQIVPENWLSLYNERLVHDKAVRALQIYMKFGMKITKIHSVLKFRQSPWMKNYIEKNIRKRKIAKANKEEFGVMYYKLKNNAVFGKQMENVCKHMRVELLRFDQDKKLTRLVRSPLFDETKGGPIGKSVCLKLKMYSVLLAGYDPKTPKTDTDFEKELEEEESRKSQDNYDLEYKKEYDEFIKEYGWDIDNPEFTPQWYDWKELFDIILEYWDEKVIRQWREKALQRIISKMTEKFNKHAERKAKNKLKYLQASITVLEIEMRTFQIKLENIIQRYSETDTSNDVEILTYTSKDILVKKIHESKDLGPVYSTCKKKRNKNKKKLLFTKSNGCPFTNCGKSVETITEASTAETEPRRNSEFSTSSLVGKMGNQLNIQSQEIIDEEMTDADNRENKDNSGASAKAHNSKDKATDMGEESNKRPIEVDSEEPNTTQDKFPSKKAKKEVKNKDSQILKRLIKKLSSNSSPQVSEISVEEGENSENLLHLYNKIINAEIRKEIASQEVIKSYYSFGKVLS